MAFTPELEHISFNNGGAKVDRILEKQNCDVATFTFQEKWGLPVEDVYRLASRFYREKEGKAPLHIPYADKLRLVAFTRQISHGPYKGSMAPDVGFFDVIGNNRRQAWVNLGDMSREDGMLRFVDLLDVLCPLFKPYIEAHKRERHDREKKGRDEENDRRKKEDDERIALSQNTLPQLQLSPHQEQQIRDALNLQTLHQFRAFCEQQLPGKLEEQTVLIAKLQEEHFQQYMKHWMEYQANIEESGKNGSGHQIVDENASYRAETSEGDTEEAVPEAGLGGLIQAASVWTRQDLKEFKDSVKNEGGEGVLKIGQGETVTIRVPTHPEGNYLFWEFATDSYDIGFGLFFEWSNNANDNRVTIHVSETDEEDEDFEGEGALDPEKGGPGGSIQSGPPVDEIIPVFRRDSHQEVVAGSHLYPARQGVYLLKFDNSFSLWRSKTLYYRVYYTR